MSLVPNVLTVLRIVMVPVFVAVFFMFPDEPGAALLVYAIAMFTDALDGRIARACNCVSRFGTLVDPLADKLMTLAALVCLTWAGVIPLPALITAAVCESAKIGAATYAARQDIVIAACLPGKLATVLFTAALVLLIPWHGVKWLTNAAMWLLFAAIALALYAAFYYMRILICRLDRARD